MQAIGPALSIAGPIIKGIGVNAADKASARASDANAQAELVTGAAREARIREAARLSMGNLVAAQGESGFVGGTGTALDELQQAQVNATLDALQARREAAGRARANQVEADQYRRAGDNALIGGVIDAFGKSQDWATASMPGAG